MKTHTQIYRAGVCLLCDLKVKRRVHLTGEIKYYDLINQLV